MTRKSTSPRKTTARGRRFSHEAQKASRSPVRQARRRRSYPLRRRSYPLANDAMLNRTFDTASSSSRSSLFLSPSPVFNPDLFGPSNPSSSKPMSLKRYKNMLSNRRRGNIANDFLLNGTFDAASSFGSSLSMSPANDTMEMRNRRRGNIANDFLLNGTFDAASSFGSSLSMSPAIDAMEMRNRRRGNIANDAMLNGTFDGATGGDNVFLDDSQQKSPSPSPRRDYEAEYNTIPFDSPLAPRNTEQWGDLLLEDYLNSPTTSPDTLRAWYRRNPWYYERYWEQEGTESLSPWNPPDEYGRRWVPLKLRSTPGSHVPTVFSSSPSEASISSYSSSEVVDSPPPIFNPVLFADYFDRRNSLESDYDSLDEYDVDAPDAPPADNYYHGYI